MSAEALPWILIALIVCAGAAYAVLHWRRGREMAQAEPVRPLADTAAVQAARTGIDALDRRMTRLEAQVTALRERIEASGPAALPLALPSPPRPRAAPVRRARSDAPTPAPGIRAIEAAYRAVLEGASPQAFGAWARNADAYGVALVPDGTLRRDGDVDGSALVAVPLDTGRACVFPGWEIVEQFSTVYKSSRNLKRVLGDSFDLDQDGGGRLTLIAAAKIARGTDADRLTERGRLGGLID